MSELNFTTMPKPDLRAYVIAHPDDRQAFEVLVDRLTAAAAADTFDGLQSAADIPTIERLIKQKLEQINITET